MPTAISIETKTIKKLSPQTCSHICFLPAPRHLRIPISFVRVNDKPIFRFTKLNDAIKTITPLISISTYKNALLTVPPLPSCGLKCSSVNGNKRRLL